MTDETVTEQDLYGAFLGQDTPLPCPLPISCLQKNFSLLRLPLILKNKFNQRSTKTQKTKENGQARQNNQNLAIKQNQYL